MQSNKTDGRIVFENKAPEDKEWSAYVRSLNEWTTPDRYLREIIQYARSGEFYPAHMHVDLIEQLYADREHRKTLEARLVELDLLEQAINQGRDMYDYKLQRLAELQSQLPKDKGEEHA